MAHDTQHEHPAFRPSTIIDFVASRLRVFEHAHLQAFLRRHPGCPKRVANKVTQGLSHLADIIVRLEPANASSRLPQGRVLTGSPLECYETLLQVWREHTGKIPVEAYTRIEYKDELAKAIGLTRSELETAEFVLNGKALELDDAEFETWTSLSELRQGKRAALNYYLAKARYVAKSGEPVVLCVPTNGSWLVDEDEKRADREEIVGALESLKAACDRNGERLVIIGPEIKGETR